MSDATIVQSNNITTNLPIRTRSNVPERKLKDGEPLTGTLLVYPTNLKRVVVKDTSNRRLEAQSFHIQTNTFTVIKTKYNELFPDTEFTEL